MLVVFDMDGTLLGADSKISDYTADTLRLMRERNIPYTIATGRTLQAAHAPLQGHEFSLPQIIKNGTVIWSPSTQAYSHQHLLTPQEVWHVLASFSIHDICPFVFTLEGDGHHAVYHPPLARDSDRQLALLFASERALPLLPLSQMPDEAHVINVSAMGPEPAVRAIVDSIANEPHLISYVGSAIQKQSLHWIDIHHSQGSKGNAINVLRGLLEPESVIVFGDGENDLSMFACADEAYAPENAQQDVKASASEVIGHHDEDGVARFLRRRFDLPSGC
jgi:Cof subfamily protein (haloacid dehalogenase superfamily)